MRTETTKKESGEENWKLESKGLISPGMLEPVSCLEMVFTNHGEMSLSRPLCMGTEGERRTVLTPKKQK